jgi:hypothetical protein
MTIPLPRTNSFARAYDHVFGSKNLLVDYKRDFGEAGSPMTRKPVFTGTGAQHAKKLCRMFILDRQNIRRQRNLSISTPDNVAMEANVCVDEIQTNFLPAVENALLDLCSDSNASSDYSKSYSHYTSPDFTKTQLLDILGEMLHKLQPHATSKWWNSQAYWSKLSLGKYSAWELDPTCTLVSRDSIDFGSEDEDDGEDSPVQYRYVTPQEQEQLVDSVKAQLKNRVDITMEEENTPFPKESIYRFRYTRNRLNPEVQVVLESNLFGQPLSSVWLEVQSQRGGLFGRHAAMEVALSRDHSSPADSITDGSGVAASALDGVLGLTQSVYEVATQPKRSMKRGLYALGLRDQLLRISQQEKQHVVPLQGLYDFLEKLSELVAEGKAQAYTTFIVPLAEGIQEKTYVPSQVKDTVAILLPQSRPGQDGESNRPSQLSKETSSASICATRTQGSVCTEETAGPVGEDELSTREIRTIMVQPGEVAARIVFDYLLNFAEDGAEDLYKSARRTDAVVVWVFGIPLIIMLKATATHFLAVSRKVLKVTSIGARSVDLKCGNGELTSSPAGEETSASEDGSEEENDVVSMH